MPQKEPTPYPGPKPGFAPYRQPPVIEGALAAAPNQQGLPDPRGPEASMNQSVDELLRSLEKRFGERDYSEDDILTFLQDRGVDVGDPEVQRLAGLPAILELFKRFVAEGDTTFIERFVVPLAGLHPGRELSDYTRAYTHFQISKLPDFEATSPEAIRMGVERRPEDYQVQRDTNALRYKNGVIADLASGQVFYPGGADVEGSAVWRLEAQKNWSEDKIKQTKAMLVSQGWLPDGAQKSGTWDVVFDDALAKFHDSKYAHGGKPVVGPYGEGGITQREVTDLRMMRATIGQDVTTHYRTMFGEDPSPEELARWTDFVIRTGNRLQREGLTAGAAQGEAEARQITALQHSPYGQFVQERDENTQLHDMIVSAAMASRDVMSRRA